jgi:hypothetical protein
MFSAYELQNMPAILQLHYSCFVSDSVFDVIERFYRIIMRVSLKIKINGPRNNVNIIRLTYIILYIWRTSAQTNMQYYF